MSTLYYLAYGSNLHPHRLKLRIPSSRFVGVVELPGYRIAFHKRGVCGSGKCNLLNTDDSIAIVYAAIYEMDAGEKMLLDQFEGAGYSAQIVNVSLHGNPLSSFAYIAETSHIDNSLKPFHWYKDLVTYGARYHQLPASYLEMIDAVESVPDPDLQRDNLHQSLLHDLGEMSA